ncbi:MAG: ATP-dependent DNA helicase [Planctomycetota bacterium]
MSVLEGLNERQRDAVLHDSGPLIVLAGPGTGKTRVITHRIARLIDEGRRPDSIAAMTFTNKAAAEMRERLGGLVGTPGEDIRAGTFHSLGLRWLARFGDTIGVQPRLQLIDSAQRKDLLEDAVIEAAAQGLIPAARLAQGGPGEVARHAWRWIERLRTQATFATGALALAERWASLIASPPADWDDDRVDAERARQAEFAEAADIYRRFENACTSRGLATFDDYILLPIRILRESGDAAAIIRDETRHVVVDEYQDVNGAQLELLRLIAPPSPTRDICVVGDDDQAIYGFRGSDTRAFDHFAEAWADATTITLDANHRSTPAIVRGAQRIIERAGSRFVADKQIEAVGDHAADSAPIEAVHVGKATPWGGVIAPMILADRALSDRGFESYAVIASTHDKLDEIADQLALVGIPVSRSRRDNALDDEAVRDLLEWIRLLIEGDAYSASRLLARPPIRMDRSEALRLRREYARESARLIADGADPPPFISWARGRSEQHLSHLVRLYDELSAAAADGPAHTAVASIIERTGIGHAELLPARERARRVAHLVAVLRFARELAARLAPPGDLGAFWAHYQRLDEADQTFRGMASIDEDAEPAFEGEGVRLITAHQSKGLEFDTVFIPNIGTGPGQLGRARPADHPELPAQLIGEEPASAKDEIRRVFYVAMTRARRRLVLMAHPAKSRSKSLHMFQELAWRGKHPLPTDEPELGVVLRMDADVLRDAAEAGVHASMDQLDAEHAGDADHRRRVLAAARRTARLEAADALEASDSRSLLASMLDDQRIRLGRSAATLCAIARIEGGDSIEDLPPWLVEDALVRARAADVHDQLNTAAEPGDTLPGLKPPLRLSFSRIDAYRRCPGCFYVKHVQGLADAASDKQLVGTVAHAALERFYRAWSDADNEGREKPAKSELVRLGRSLFFEAASRSGQIDRKQLAHLESQLDAGYDTFHDDDAEIVMIEERLKLRYQRSQDDAEHHTIEAKIDRVERMPGGHGFRIIDYKTGGAWKSLVDPESDDLQLGIYALAVADAYGIPPEELTGEAAYWVLSSQQAGTIAIEDLDLGAVRGVIDGAIAGMLEGRFERGKKCEGLCTMFRGSEPQL